MTFPLFGKEIDIQAENFNDVQDEALRLQSIFNLYDEDSELSHLNRERILEVSDELLYVLKTALRFCQLTNGVYDITKGAQYLSKKEGKDTCVSCKYTDMTIIGSTVILEHPDIILDLGSIAKGYIADRIGQYLGEYHLIDARGDLLLGEKTKVTIEHPNGHDFREVEVKGAVATSGNSRQNHLKGSNQVTIIGPELMIADALATCVVESGVTIMKFFPEYEVIIVE